MEDQSVLIQVNDEASSRRSSVEKFRRLPSFSSSSGTPSTSDDSAESASSTSASIYDENAKNLNLGKLDYFIYNVQAKICISKV